MEGALHQIRQGAPLPPPTLERLEGVKNGAVGAMGACLMHTTGVNVAIHEVVGHGYLGNHLIYDYAPGEGPTYQVDGWDNFKAIFESESIPAGLKNTVLWLTGHDRNQDGAAGWCDSGYGRPNELGEEMGHAGRRAWVSIAGSVPGLAIDSAMVVGAMKVRKNHPQIAAAMMGYALTDHACNSLYPIHAATMTSTELFAAAQKGHDFANWAVKIGAMMGVSAVSVARVTAIVWTGIVPLIALTAYLYQRSKETELVSDEMALAHWAEKAENHERLVELLSDDIVAKPIHEVQKHLIQELGSDILDGEKREVLEAWHQDLPEDKTAKTLGYLSMGASGVGLAAKILTVMAETAHPGLKPFARVLSVAFPAMQLLAVIRAVYQAHKDFKSNAPQITKKVKAFSVAKACVVGLGAIGMLTGTYLRRSLFLFAGATAATIALPVLFDYLRAEEIRRQLA